MLAVFGPDAFGYTADDAAPFTFEDISGTGTTLNLLDDGFSAALNLGFNFDLYGQTFQSVFVGANGLLEFGSGSEPSAANHNLLTGAGGPEPLVAVLWDDWDPALPGANNIYVQSSGVAESDLRFIIQWSDVLHNNFEGGGTVDFQAVLFETGDIEFRYNSVAGIDASVDDGTSATVGIRNQVPPSPEDGEVLQITFNDAANTSVSSGQTIRITHPPIVLRDLGPDALEPNDTRTSASVMGSLSQITLNDLSIHDNGNGTTNDDFFRYTAPVTGKTVVNVHFDEDNGDDVGTVWGDLDIEILDMNGNVLANGNTVTHGEQVTWPVVNQQPYFLRISNVDGNPNTYTLEVESFTAVVPAGIYLDPASDTGLSTYDGLTNDDTPRIVVQADLAQMGIAVLSAGEAATTNTPGAAVEVTIIHADSGNTFTGFADQVGASQTVFAFEPTEPLLDGTYFASAAVRVFDPQGDPLGNPNPAQGRTTLSVPRWFTIDTVKPNVFFGKPTVMEDGLSLISDTGVPGAGLEGSYSDRITSDTTPGFWGTTEANSIVRVFVRDNIDQRVLIAQSAQAIPTGFPPIAPARWSAESSLSLNDPALNFAEIDGVRQLEVEATDAAGNVSLHQFEVASNENQPIADTATSDFTVEVNDVSGLLADVDVRLDITHTSVGSLDVQLISPGGTTISLFAGIGGTADNFRNTILDGDSTDTIAGAVAPFSGRFQPVGPLGDLAGEDPNGTWTLRVTDTVAGEVGTVDRFSLCLQLEPLEIFLDTQGSTVTSVGSLDALNLDFTDIKTVGPTPSIETLTIDIQDFPNRDAQFLYDALVRTAVDGNPSENPNNYILVGDTVGRLVPTNVSVTNSISVAGNPATATIFLQFAAPLPDDRYQLTVTDNPVDSAGNRLDGNGDGLPGEHFVQSFTIDTRPEVGVWSGGTAAVDINGNYLFDPNHPDSTNRDVVYKIGFGSDYLFSGNFPTTIAGVTDGYDKLAAYGRGPDGDYRWLIDRTNDGVSDPLTGIPEHNINGFPVAGDFNQMANDGDEVGLFTGTQWYLDMNADGTVGDNQPINSNLRGFPFVGDFDGDGTFDLATYNNADGQFQFSFSNAEVPTGTVDATITFNFPGVSERPVAHDVNADGLDDLGLWVPDNNTRNSQETGEWFFLISDGGPVINRRVPGARGEDTIPFTPIPFGVDQFVQFGDDFSLPLLGNFDPPLPAIAAIESPAPPDNNDNSIEDGSYDNAVSDDSDEPNSNAPPTNNGNDQDAPDVPTPSPDGPFDPPAISNSLFAYDVSLNVSTNQTSTIDVLTAAQQQNSNLQVTISMPPDHGTVTVQPDRSVRYNADTDFIGLDFFGFTIEDGFGQNASALALLQISSTLETQAPPAVAIVEVEQTPEPATLPLPVTDSQTPVTVGEPNEPDNDQRVSGLPVQQRSGVLPLVSPKEPIAIPEEVRSGVVSIASQAVSAVQKIVSETSAPRIFELTISSENGQTTTVDLRREVNGDIPVTLAQIHAPRHGQAFLASNGNVAYSPSPGFFGTDWMAYTVEDAQGLRWSALIWVKVTGHQGDSASTIPQIAQPTSGSGPLDIGFATSAPRVFELTMASTETQTATIDITREIDTDPNVRLAEIRPPRHGKAWETSDGNICYTPDPGFSGSDWMLYTAEGTQNPSSALIWIEVSTPRVVTSFIMPQRHVGFGSLQPVEAPFPAISMPPKMKTTEPDDLNSDSPTSGTNKLSASTVDPPTPPQSFTNTLMAFDRNISLQQDDAVVVSLTDRASIQIQLLSVPAHGRAVLNGDGTVTYAPEDGFVGSDLVAYRLIDSIGRQADAVITFDVKQIVHSTPVVAAPPQLTIVPVVIPEKPVADPQSVTEDGAKPVNSNTESTQTTNQFEPSSPKVFEPTMTSAAGQAVTLDITREDNSAVPVQLTQVRSPQHGQVAITTNGNITYSPTPGFNGIDWMMYTAETAVERSSSPIWIEVSRPPNEAAAAAVPLRATPAPFEPVVVDLAFQDFFSVMS